jgi:hypothetical protein
MGLVVEAKASTRATAEFDPLWGEAAAQLR